jgi:hypothetical protein
MNFYKWLTVIGGVLLVFGVLTAFISSHFTDRVMGEARKGMAVFGAERGTPERLKKERLLWWADFWFYVGLVLTAIGVTLQTLGSILPLPD